MAIIDISDIDLVVLVQNLWKHQKLGAFFLNAPWMVPSEPCIGDIKACLEAGYIDYIAGRCIQTNFSDLTKVNTRSYDRDAGEGTFERIVADLRKNKD